jgi:hypothetical protein
LCLGEGKVLIPFGFPRRAAKLRAANYNPVEVELFIRNMIADNSVEVNVCARNTGHDSERRFPAY